MATKTPTCRWGIVATGLISSWFVEDLVLPRPDAKAEHIIQCVGSSSIEKGRAFAERHFPNRWPAIYASYEEVYNDPNVDCVYIGTPHSFHKQNCLDAIAAGKNVLCEKPFAINAREAREILDAAEEKGVYVAEAMWLRHRPLVTALRDLLFKDKAIGEVFRTFANFSLFVDIPSLPETSRYKDVRLGAGTVLDIGICSLTWTFLTLDPHAPGSSEMPEIVAKQTHQDGIEVMSNVILQYPSTGKQGTVSSTTMSGPRSNIFCRIYGTEGHIEIEGTEASIQKSFIVYQTGKGTNYDVPALQGRKYVFASPARGFIYEADNTAADIAAGLKESTVMPWKETIRVMEIMDEIRRQGGTKYPQD